MNNNRNSRITSIQSTGISQFRKGKRINTVITILGGCFVLFWLVFDFTVLRIRFASLSGDTINELSRLIVMTSGILVSFVVASAFFYLGKIGDLFVMASTNSNRLLLVVSRTAERAKRVRNLSEKAKIEMLVSCEKCAHEKPCNIQAKELELFESPPDTILNEVREEVERDFSINHELERTVEGRNRTYFLITTAFLFVSVFTALGAFITGDYSWLVTSLDFVVYGGVWILITLSDFNDLGWLRYYNRILVDLRRKLAELSSQIRTLQEYLMDLQGECIVKRALELKKN